MGNRIFLFDHSFSFQIFHRPLTIPKKNIFIPFIASAFVLFILAGFPATLLSAEHDESKVVRQPSKLYATAELDIKIIPGINNTFGYDITLDGRPFIHQPHIPGMPGNEGFPTTERARKVAELVVKKIRNNEMPPGVTVEELNSLGVLQ